MITNVVLPVENLLSPDIWEVHGYRTIKELDFNSEIDIFTLLETKGYHVHLPIVTTLREMAAFDAIPRLLGLMGELDLRYEEWTSSFAQVIAQDKEKYGVSLPVIYARGMFHFTNETDAVMTTLLWKSVYGN